MPFNAFLKIDDIEGGSTVKGHKGEIEVLSWGWGLVTPTTGGGGVGKAQASDFTFAMEPSVATPDLAVAVCTGDHFEKAIFTAEEVSRGRFNRGGYIKITMADVLVSSYQTGGAGGAAPTDQVSLNFSKIEIEYGDERGQNKKSFCDFQSDK
jgi:type VI secretion system secreted protein Hcp